MVFWYRVCLLVIGYHSVPDLVAMHMLRGSSWSHVMMSEFQLLFFLYLFIYLNVYLALSIEEKRWKRELSDAVTSPCTDRWLKTTLLEGKNAPVRCAFFFLLSSIIKPLLLGRTLGRHWHHLTRVARGGIATILWFCYVEVPWVIEACGAVPGAAVLVAATVAGHQCSGCYLYVFPFPQLSPWGWYPHCPPWWCYCCYSNVKKSSDFYGTFFCLYG